ncbi:hypothetical protein MMC34_000772 [Xylographa carneopallida]|nr:hypothetical protein [Xylographa carneopallida]
MSAWMLVHAARRQQKMKGCRNTKPQTPNRASYIALPLQPDGNHVFRLLDLPAELRLMIYRHLLPNKQTIEVTTEIRDHPSGDSRAELWVQDHHLRTDHDRVSLDFLRTCRQIYHEIVPDLLYTGRKFVVAIPTGAELQLGVWQVSWDCVRAFPFHQIQCLEVQIWQPLTWNAAALLKIRRNICGLVDALSRSPALNEIIINPDARDWTTDSLRLGVPDWYLILQPFVLARANTLGFDLSVGDDAACRCVWGRYEAASKMMEFVLLIAKRIESSDPSGRCERAHVQDQTRLMERAIGGCFWRVRAMFRKRRRPDWSRWR